SSLDRIKEILGQLEATEAEPDGNDEDLIRQLEAMVVRGIETAAPAPSEPEPSPETADVTQGSLIDQTLERPLRPGEVSLDDLERAFRETAVEDAPPRAEAAPKAGAKPKPAKTERK